MNHDQDKTVISDLPGDEKPKATQKIGHYEVVAELGRGGMGTVFRGYEPSLNRYVAIKVLASHLADDDSLVGRFSREAKSVAALNHPNVVHIYMTGEQDGLPFFAMECIEGDTLADQVRTEGSLPSKQAAKYLLQAAKGLGAAHDRGIIHRDVKPSNLMVDASGTIKITDFGIALARDIGDKLTTTGQFVGTTGYVSPEVFQGRPVDSRSDIFSLGVVLFEMLAGVKPFDDESPMGLMLQVVEKPAPDVRSLNPDVDAPLQQILMRMIEKDPNARYQTCHELVIDLEHYLAGEPLEIASAAEVPPPQPQPDVEPKRSSRTWPVLLLLLLASGATAYWWRAPLLELAGITSMSDIEEPSAAIDEKPSAALSEEPSAAIDEKPSAVIDNKPSAAVGDEPSAPVEGEHLANLADNSSPELAQSDQVTGADATANESSEVGSGVDLVTNQSKPAVTKGPSDKAASDAIGADKINGAAEPATVYANAEPAVALQGAVVAVRGDPSVVGPLAARLETVLDEVGLNSIEPGFIAGASQALQAQKPELAMVRGPLLDAGGRYLLLVTASAVDAKAMEFYGQYDTLYTAQVELVAYDLAQLSTVGRWSEKVQYTNLNAATNTEAAFEANLDELSRRLTNQR